MIVLAIDAGPVRWGVAIVEVVDGRLSLVQGCHREIVPTRRDDVMWVAGRVGEVIRRDGVVVAETIRGFAYDATRVQALIETGRAEGGLQWLCAYLGARHEPVAANDVRRDLVLDPQASDDRIAVVVEWLYGRAMCHDRIQDPNQRPHIYDAMLLAAWFIAKATGRLEALKPSGKVAAQLVQMKQTEQAARAQKKAERKMAAPVAMLLAGMVKAKAIPTIPTIVQRVGITHDVVVTALRVVARGRSDVATAARALLKASGYPTTDPARKRIGTRVQREARKEAAQRGARTRKAG